MVGAQAWHQTSAAVTIAFHSPRALSMRKYILLFALLCAAPAVAESQELPLQPLPAVLESVLPAPVVDADSWLLADFGSGWIIGGANMEARIEPASLTKLMTGYLVFDALARGEISRQDEVLVSEKAWRTGGSKMFIRVGTRVSIEDLLRGLIIQSGNDAAVALAEHLGGSEAGFAALMNQTAARLGMNDSHFVNSSGLPHPQHYSSALDMTILTRALIHRFPRDYRLYSEQEFTYNGITQRNRNSLLKRDPSVDGIKTGYTEKAGYCLIGTAARDRMRLIATVIGAPSMQARADQVHALLQYGYAAYRSREVYAAGATVKELPLWFGQAAQARVVVPGGIQIIHPKGDAAQLSGKLALPASLDAPLQTGQTVGRIEVQFDGVTVRDAALQTDADYPPGAWGSRLVDWFKRMVFQLTH